ncbi:fasciclin domain-containing protein [Chlorogloeopsis sp. ULAP01]|uniref:fasciclin domain-containing protein n=1 Tax=Chlorogloeopsis sp. ULAP01 TaxID=3056483 RepID=UPI0025AB2CF3|nr:fasciclin domain-containing protein [Chlorogloeopsis sp. ULAP01]MDM9380420.1 fasciclin domain-containing protein [Chlorogloeopsis sp. ULAP01]
MADIVETAVNAGSFKTLLKAVDISGLTETIKSPGPYTIFAPTDDAFANLSQETLDSLLQNTEKLKRIVAYHIAFGDVRSDDLAQIDEAETVEGSVIAIESANGKSKVNDANIIKTDILADNGVIHVIDVVLMPAILAGH